MNIKEYFGDWCDLVDLDRADSIKNHLIKSNKVFCPKIGNVFKCFRLCSFSNLKVVFLGYDPYPNLVNNQPVATGLAFANTSDTIESNYSPSLKVLKDSISYYVKSENNCIFEPSLESWEKQGVLLLNSALSCEVFKTGSHSLLWRPFIASLLLNLTLMRDNIVYVLLGSVAQSFSGFINHKTNHVIECHHPAYYARKHERMPDIWNKVNNYLINDGNSKIEWYNNV